MYSSVEHKMYSMETMHCIYSVEPHLFEDDENSLVLYMICKVCSSGNVEARIEYPLSHPLIVNHTVPNLLNNSIRVDTPSSGIRAHLDVQPISIAQVGQ